MSLRANGGIAALLYLLIPSCAGCWTHTPSVQAAQLLDTGIALLKDGDLPRARSACELAIEYRPKLPEAHNCLGLIATAEGDLDRAIDHFKDALAHKDDFLEVHNNLGNVFLERGEVDQACGAFTAALEIDPGYVPARRNLGACQLRAGQIDAADESFRRCLLLDEGACDCRLGQGAVAIKRGDLAAAEIVFAESVVRCPTLPEAHYNLCWARVQTAHCDAAATSCQTALQLRPGYLEARDVLDAAVSCSAIEGAARGTATPL